MCTYVLLLYVYFDKMLNSVVVTFLFSLRLCLPLVLNLNRLFLAFFLFLCVHFSFAYPSLGTGNYFSLFTFSNIFLISLVPCMSHFCSLSCPWLPSLSFAFVSCSDTERCISQYIRIVSVWLRQRNLHLLKFVVVASLQRYCCCFRLWRLSSFFSGCIFHFTRSPECEHQPYK